MAYIGNDLRSNEDYKIIDDISSGFNGSATSFALQVGGATPVPFPKFEQQLLISVNGVIQEPDPTGSAGFKLSGTNIVFSSAPTNGHAFFGVIYAGADYVNAGGAFPDGSINFPSITFGADTNTGFTRIASGTVALISDGTKVAQFPTNQGSSGQALITDGGGNLSFGTPSTITVSDESSDTTCFPLFATAASGNLGAKSGSNLTFNSNTGVLTATSFAGSGANLTGINTDLVSDTTPQLGGDLDANTNNILFGDSASSADDRIKFGASTDLQIFHDGNSKIQNSNNGCDLRIISDTVELKGNSADEMMLKAVVNNQVELYHNNSKKFETQAGGTLTTGNLTSNLAGGTAGQGQLNLGSSGAPFVRGFDTGNHGSGSKLELISGDGDDHIVCKRNGAVEIFHDASKKFETSSGGCTVTGTLSTSGTGNVNLSNGAGAITVNSGGDIRLNNASWTGDYAGKIQHANNFLYFQGGTGIYAFIFRDPDGANRLYIDENGHVLPADDNSYDLGSTSKRWRNVYTNDLKLSNEGSQNDVDSTWGNYTIQEGHEDLFLINHRTGKKFKFNLTEVG